jgi:hypothetical protein
MLTLIQSAHVTPLDGHAAKIGPGSHSRVVAAWPHASFFLLFGLDCWNAACNRTFLLAPQRHSKVERVILSWNLPIQWTHCSRRNLERCETPEPRRRGASARQRRSIRRGVTVVVAKPAKTTPSSLVKALICRSSGTHRFSRACSWLPR